ncbi:hypothetical protein SC206_18380 [Rouxiella sp. T17]|uniref:hypothetical protein n=1 Tax=Rouxiella sp. T17 TaxID=3085684 RepID=UPI002FC79E76
MSMSLKDVFELIQLCIQAKPQVTNRDMRSMLTQVFSRTLKAHTVFTGDVSEAAVTAIEEMQGVYQGHKVVREHHLKSKTSITKMIAEMRKTDNWNFEAFERRIVELSSINITTVSENYLLARSGATYETLGIKLIHWENLSADVKRLIRKSLLRADIANRAEWNID